MSEKLPIKLAILWHMHQPDYRDATSEKMVLPWVRLHALKDYLDMPLLASKYQNVKVTFNIVPALIDQLELYIKGGTDPHLELSKIDSEILTYDEKVTILKTFFSAPLERMIAPYKRYHDLYKKAQASLNDKNLPSLFTAQEMRDIQVWSNLVWIDPIFRDDTVIASLFKKERQFSEIEKANLLLWQIEHLKKIIPTYQRLYKEKKIDISFTPYYHPILPLLCDTDSAKEALPNIELPQQRFVHPDDADKQIRMSADKFQEIFDSKIEGMWPSEGSVSETALKLIADNKIKWVATDEEILLNSIKKSQLDPNENHPYQIYKHQGLYIFFRDHALSDRVGFVYSGMNSKDAVNDFIDHIHKIRDRFIDNLKNIVITVILDGENAWEYFKDDGTEFLELLYKKLHEDKLISAVGMSECLNNVTPVELPALFSGSWINHNFKIWIGHPEDNRAWDLLYIARKFLVTFENENQSYNKSLISQAWNKIYIAEGSDWCWWYGDEHRGEHNKEFDEIFRNHLSAVYSLLNAEIPAEFKLPIYSGAIIQKAVMPDGLVTPIIDGKRSSFYEWGEAGYFDVTNSGGAMHRVSKAVDKIYFAFDHDNFYLRVLFDFSNFSQNSNHRIVIKFSHLQNFNIEIPFGKCNTVSESNLSYAFDKELEIAIKRVRILPDQFGKIQFDVSLFEDDKKIETVPEIEPIQLVIPEANQEMFWPN